MKRNTIYFWMFNGIVLIISAVVYLGILTDIKFLVDDPVNYNSSNSNICYLITAKLSSIIFILILGNVFLAFLLKQKSKKMGHWL